MKEILFLSHRIPYPPNKGDKIRSWNLLKGLAGRYRVHLGTFVDDPHDWQFVDTLREVCCELCVRPLNPSVGRLRALTSLATGRSLSIGYYRDRKLAAWVRELASARQLSGVFVFSSSMAQYADDLPLLERAPRVVDLCDVDSDKWRQYADAKRAPGAWVYRRETRLLADVERRCVEEFDSALVIAEPEAAILRSLVPGVESKVRVLANGVDTDTFDPARPHPDPFQGSAGSVVFTGAMDYHPNVDGVVWFAREILPDVRRRAPQAHFWIVGSNPSAAVRDLDALEGVTVTGRVDDVRPYLAHAAVVVAPLRIARGVQNKVLEGLAMARPIVATPNAVQGIEGVGPRELRTAASAGDFARAVAEILESATTTPVEAARMFVCRNFGWDARIQALRALMEEGAGSGPATPANVSALDVRAAGAGG